MTAIGYARVSTADQVLDLQVDALRAAACERIFEDTASGVKTARPGLDKALAYIRDGDVLVMWKLDRLGRSVGQLVQTVQRFEAAGAGFRSLTEGIDTTTTTGRLLLHLFASLALCHDKGCGRHQTDRNTMGGQALGSRRSCGHS